MYIYRQMVSNIRWNTWRITYLNTVWPSLSDTVDGHSSLLFLINQAMRSLKKKVGQSLDRKKKTFSFEKSLWLFCGISRTRCMASPCITLWIFSPRLTCQSRVGGGARPALRPTTPTVSQWDRRTDSRTRSPGPPQGDVIHSIYRLNFSQATESVNPSH